MSIFFRYIMVLISSLIPLVIAMAFGIPILLYTLPFAMIFSLLNMIVSAVKSHFSKKKTILSILLILIIYIILFIIIFYYKNLH